MQLILDLAFHKIIFILKLYLSSFYRKLPYTVHFGYKSNSLKGSPRKNRFLSYKCYFCQILEGCCLVKDELNIFCAHKLVPKSLFLVSKHLLYLILY